MAELLPTPKIIELNPENLVIAAREKPEEAVVQIKVYEQESFLANPNLLTNQKQIAQYSACPDCCPEAMAEVREMYAGWSRIDMEQDIKLIGLHNQNPSILYIQFSLDQRYFIYQRCVFKNREMVQEELFGKKHECRHRALNRDDEQYLISKLRFMPKTKKAISFYTRKNLF